MRWRRQSVDIWVADRMLTEMRVSGGISRLTDRIGWRDCHKYSVDNIGNLFSSEGDEIGLFKGLLKVFNISIFNLLLQIVVKFRPWRAQENRLCADLEASLTSCVG